MAIKDTGTEQLIKETAKKVFFGEGKLHATTQDIADVAGISRTSLHYYFRSRDELMRQVFNEAEHDLNNKLYVIMASSIPFKGKIEKLVEVYLTETMAFPYRETFVIVEMLSNNNGIFKFSEEGSPHVNAFLKQVEKEIKAGNIRQMKPVQFMMNMMALISHPLIMRPLHKSLFNIKDEQFNKLINERKKLIVETLLM